MHYFIFQLFLNPQSINFFDPDAIIVPLSPADFSSSADSVVTTFISSSSPTRSAPSNSSH